MGNVKREKTPEEIEKTIEKKIVRVLNSVDEEDTKKNTKIIEIDLDRKFDFIRKYNDKKVSLKLLEYLIDQIGICKNNEKVKIVLNKRCELDINAIKLIKDGLKEEYKKSFALRDQNNLKQLWMLTMGVIILFLSTKMPESTIWKEVLVIVGWVPIWEMIEVELFPDAVERKRRKSIKRLLKCEIIEKTLVNENIESIEINKLEEEIK